MSIEPLIALSVGNSRVRIGLFRDGPEPESTAVFPLRPDAADRASDPVPDERASVAAGPRETAAGGTPPLVHEALAAWIRTHLPGLGAVPRIVLASVRDQAADPIADHLDRVLGATVQRVGTDVPVPIATALDADTTPGVDRLLAALAAYEVLQQACIVIDAGTAVTVDFVDGEGTFHGGAIAPGLRMQLDALHAGTERLPAVAMAMPDEDPFGRSTASAMRLGVYHGIRGLTARMIDLYAERYAAYPTVVATGGDAAMLFRDEPLIDRVVPDLVLRGIAIAARAASGAAST